MTACWLASCSSDEPVIDQEPEFDAILGGVKDGVIQVGDVESSLTDQILSGNVCLEAIDVQNFTRRVEESRWNFEKLESGCVQMESYSIPDKILFIDGKFVSKKEKKLVCNRWAYFNALELIQQVIPHHYTTYVEYPLQYDMTSRSLKSNVFNVQLLGAKAGQVMMAAEEIYHFDSDGLVDKLLWLKKYTVGQAQPFSKDDIIFGSDEEAYDWVATKLQEAMELYLAQHPQNTSLPEWEALLKNLEAEKLETTLIW